MALPRGGERGGSGRLSATRPAESSGRLHPVGPRVSWRAGLPLARGSPVRPPDDHTLTRGLGLWEATAVNVTQIVGAGVFATIPLILGVLPGAYALLAWVVAGVLILFDGMIWGELGAALPSSGGSYHFLLEGYGRSRWGRLMAFLFVWQILISGPLEVGSGLVAAAQFSTALSPGWKAFDEEHTRKVEIKIDDEPQPDGKVLG